MKDHGSTEFHPDDVDAVALLWRRSWSDCSCSKEAAGEGPGFILWRSKLDSTRCSGVFYPAAKVHEVLTDPALAEGVSELLDDIDHQVSVVVVLGFETQEQAIAVTVDKLEPMKSQIWYEMPEIRKRSLNTAVWVPLRVSEKLLSEGESGREGNCEEFFGLGSVMFSTELARTELGLGWADIGISNNYKGGDVTRYFGPDRQLERKTLFACHLPFSKSRCILDLESRSGEATKISCFLTAGDYGDHRSDAVGTSLVINQEFESGDLSVWHLHQDFVVSLQLIRERDSWLRPDEGYLEVARLLRNDSGEPVRLEVRAEQLRDYLCARGMNLYISSFQSRVEVCSSRSHVDWDPVPVRASQDSIDWEGRVSEIHDGGMQYGATTSVFRASRTDVDDDEDVPAFGHPTNGSVKSESWTRESSGCLLYRISGDLWRVETIEAGCFSERIRGDDPQHPTFFIVDAAGNKESKDRLVGGDSRWLWFKPEVMREFLGIRGVHIVWHTKDTGSIRMNTGSSLHFGINDLGLINIYAKDIGMLSNWEQRTWAGFNVGPEGKVSKELLASQMHVRPADTLAPEAHLMSVYNAVNEHSTRVFGKDLFSSHQAKEDLFLRAHRFRALDRGGLLELAKDLARLTVECIDGTGLSSIAKPPKGSGSGSIKHLEVVLATRVGDVEARKITGVLVGVNKLRQADAHLPSRDLGEAFVLAGISETGSTIHEAQQMLHSLVDSLYAIADAFAKT